MDIAHIFDVISNSPKATAIVAGLILGIETGLAKSPIKSNCTVDFIAAFIRGGIKEAMKKPDQSEQPKSDA